MNELIAQFDHFVDSHHGIYSGKIFAEYLDHLFKTGNITGISNEDWKSLLAGPDDEFYLDAWANIDNVTITDEQGIKWMVYQNEGIYLYPESIHEQINFDELW